MVASTTPHDISSFPRIFAYFTLQEFLPKILKYCLGNHYFVESLVSYILIDAISTFTLQTDPPFTRPFKTSLCYRLVWGFLINYTRTFCRDYLPDHHVVKTTASIATMTCVSWVFQKYKARFGSEGNTLASILVLTCVIWVLQNYDKVRLRLEGQEPSASRLNGGKSEEEDLRSPMEGCGADDGGDSARGPVRKTAADGAHINCNTTGYQVPR